MQRKKRLLENLNLTMFEQENILNATLEKWKGILEQVGHVLVIGTRI